MYLYRVPYCRLMVSLSTPTNPSYKTYQKKRIYQTRIQQNVSNKTYPAKRIQQNVSNFTYPTKRIQQNVSNKTYLNK